jgi:predicted metal-dependent peptidase
MWVQLAKDESLGISLGFNPIYLAKITDNQSLEGVLVHEMFHLIFKHFERTPAIVAWCKREDRIFSPDLLNKAQDIPINDMLISWAEPKGNLNLNKDTWFYNNGCNTYHNGKADFPNPFANYEKEKQAEFYFKKMCDEHGAEPGSASKSDKALEEFKKAVEEAGNSSGDHTWMQDTGDGSEPAGGPGGIQGPPSLQGLSELHKSLLEETIREGIKEDIKSKNIGSGSLAQILGEIYPVKEVAYKWQNLLSRALRSGRFTERKLTNRREIRRLASVPSELLPFKYPSYESIKDFKVVMIVDTSGSMDPESLVQCYEMILSLKTHKPKLRFYVIEWDCQFQREFEIKSRKDIQDNLPNCAGRGGTEFHNAIAYAMEKYRPDTLVYATDGYGNAGSRSVLGRTSMIWMLSKDSQKPCDWGIHIPMKLTSTKEV